MTASPPAVPPDRSPYAWARSLKGALSAAQQLALRQIGRLQALELDVLAKPLRQAADALADGGPMISSTPARYSPKRRRPSPRSEGSAAS